MRIRWRAALPLCGLALFAFGTYASYGPGRISDRTSRYFWWSSLRLDSDPLNRHSKSVTAVPCKDSIENCMTTDPIYVLVDPGWLAKCLILSAAPAFLAGAGIVYGLARFGVSEVTSFMVSMPLLILTWFYFVGWLLDRWSRKRIT
jgi:hypothetical protein